MLEYDNPLMNETMSRHTSTMLAIAGVSLLIATSLGAYAAHGLDRILPPDALSTFRIGVQYHFYHGLGLIGVTLLSDRFPMVRAFRISAWLLIAGTILFSGSLYVTAFGSLRFLGMAAPIGGLCFLGAWLSVSYGAWSNRPRSSG